MTDLSCPVCKSDSYLNPNIKILVSPCFHKLCEHCIYKIFANGTAPCPQCQLPLRRINYIASTFEDIEIEREIKIRKILTRYLTRTEDEFDNIFEFNDYLEEFENLVFNLLPIKNDTKIRTIINEIRESESILNPKSKVESLQIQNCTDEKTPVCTVVEKKYFENKNFNIKKNIKIPENIMSPFEASGLTKEIVVNYMIYSVFE